MHSMHSGLRLLQAMSAAASHPPATCHAEGRGFESLHPLAVRSMSRYTASVTIRVACASRLGHTGGDVCGSR